MSSRDRWLGPDLLLDRRCLCTVGYLGDLTAIAAGQNRDRKVKKGSGFI